MVIGYEPGKGRGDRNGLSIDRVLTMHSELRGGHSAHHQHLRPLTRVLQAPGRLRERPKQPDVLQ